jgi:hypothetical protein
MAVGFTSTYAISGSSNPAQERCTGYNIMWSSLSLTCDRSVVSSTNKIDRHGITEILSKVALNSITIFIKVYVIAFGDHGGQ